MTAKVPMTCLYITLSAMGGVFIAASCFVPAVGNGYDDDWILISRTTVGAIVGMALWLLYTYSRRTVTKDG